MRSRKQLLGVGTRVLIVDDDQLVANALARALKALGYEVNCQTNATVALDALESFLPEMVMTDLHMPGMRGTAFLTEVKRRDPTIRRAVVSAHLEDINDDERVAIEPCALVAKPWTAATLKSIVEAIHEQVAQ